MITDHDPGDEHDDRPRATCPMCGRTVIMQPTTDTAVYFWHIGTNERMYPTHTADHCGIKLLQLPLDAAPVPPGTDISIGSQTPPALDDDPRLS